MEPGPELYRTVKIGFLIQGTSFNKWCGNVEKGNRRNVTSALQGGWRGPKGRALAERAARAAGVAGIIWDTTSATAHSPDPLDSAQAELLAALNAAGGKSPQSDSGPDRGGA